MLLAGLIRVTENITAPPAARSLTIDFVAEDGTVFDSSGAVEIKPGQSVSYGFLFSDMDLASMFSGLPITPASVAAVRSKLRSDVVFNKTSGATDKIAKK